MNTLHKNVGNVGVVILAAGDGKRMKSALPKVMHELNGKSFVEHAVEHVEKANCVLKPVVVVSPKHTMVQDTLGERAEYVVQPEQLGTGHAVSVAQSLLENKADHIVVLYADHPFISPDSIKRLITKHAEKDNTVTLMLFTVPNFEGIYSPFKSFSRIIRGENGHIVRDVQVKDATEEELMIKECNPSYYCFKASWLWSKLKTLKNNNSQKEYYLTDLIQMAIAEGEKISSVLIEPKEAIGINTAEDLEVARSL